MTPNPGPAWKAIGTGDFNKDGKSDILWQNANTGQVSIWEMNGNNLLGGGPVTPNPGTAWQAIGTGDFNQDGSSDILFQNKTTGQVSVWEMDGTSLIGGGKVSANPGPSWHAIGTGASGSDILLQNTSGQASIWDMHGNTIIGGGAGQPQSRAELASGRGDLTELAEGAVRKPRSKPRRASASANSTRTIERNTTRGLLSLSQVQM